MIIFSYRNIKKYLIYHIYFIDCYFIKNCHIIHKYIIYLTLACHIRCCLYIWTPLSSIYVPLLFYFIDVSFAWMNSHEFQYIFSSRRTLIRETITALCNIIYNKTEVIDPACFSSHEHSTNPNILYLIGPWRKKNNTEITMFLTISLLNTKYTFYASFRK